MYLLIRQFAQGGVAWFCNRSSRNCSKIKQCQQTRQLCRTDVPNSGGGVVGGTAPAQPPAPQMMSGAFELSGGVEPEPTRAYVVTDEMTNSQNQLANIRRRATI